MLDQLWTVSPLRTSSSIRVLWRERRGPGGSSEMEEVLVRERDLPEFFRALSQQALTLPPKQMRSRGLNSTAKGYLKGIQEAQAETGKYTGRWVRAHPNASPCLSPPPALFTSPPALHLPRLLQTAARQAQPRRRILSPGPLCFFLHSLRSLL